MKKQIFIIPALFLISFLFLFTSVNAVGTGSVSTTPVTNYSNEDLTNKGKELNELVTGQVPVITIDDAETWGERKGFELVHLLQKWIQPISIIIFILSAIMALFGALGNSRLVGKGMWGMGIAVVLYAVVLYAPELMDGFLNWVST